MRQPYGCYLCCINYFVRFKKDRHVRKNLFRVVFAHRLQNFFCFLFGGQIEIDQHIARKDIVEFSKHRKFGLENIHHPKLYEVFNLLFEVVALLVFVEIFI